MSTRFSLVGSMACFSAFTVLLLLFPLSNALVPNRALSHSTPETHAVTLPHQLTSTFAPSVNHASRPHQAHQQGRSLAAHSRVSTKLARRKQNAKFYQGGHQKRSVSSQGVDVGVVANTCGQIDSVDTASQSLADANLKLMSASSLMSSNSYAGQATYYSTGLGACGLTSTDSSMIAAASHLLFDSFPGATGNPNDNPICGRKVKVQYQGRSVEVSIVDRCTGCAMYDLDLSPAAFKELASLDAGRLSGMTWTYIK